MALRRDEEGRLAFWTAEGRFEWPGDAERILGAEHSYARPIRDDLLLLRTKDELSHSDIVAIETLLSDLTGLRTVDPLRVFVLERALRER